jgi:Fic family protein
MIPPFTITPKALDLVVKITEVLAKVDTDFKSDVMLRKKNRIKTITGTLAIEGNTLDAEQVTAILEGKRVMGKPSEIQEVHGAIRTYDALERFDPYRLDDLLRAHGMMMSGLVSDAGRFRGGNVGVHDGGEVIHIAPPAGRVPELMGNLIAWLKETEVNPLIAGCVFHYEFEFIHPFSDGNGRMGRLWQTVVLSRYNPVFAYFPIESVVREKQREYYDALAVCDEEGNSTVFVEFMLGCILEAVQSVPKNVPNNDPKTRPERLLLVIRETPGISARELAEHFGVAEKTIKRDIEKLKADGRLKRVGPLKGGHWEVIE